MDLTGRHLGKYKLLQRAGQGGMASVYKAYQPTIDRFVAVKVLHSHLADDAEFLERFKREAKGLGQLRHPHIVNVIDFDVDDGWYYMVMDFIEGETLEAALNRRSPLPVAEALRLAAQLAGALDYAHRHGRIHRDVKPGNIMFADTAQQHVVITDFGLTRLLDNATLTMSGTVAGTPAYMSPEAAQGQRVDGRGDIYSLGVVLYEMVTGQRPFRGETPLSIMMKLVLEPLPPALSVRPDLPPAVDALLQKATARQPEARYQSAADMRQAILATQEIKGNSAARAQNSSPVALLEQKATQTQLLATPATPDLSVGTVADAADAESAVTASPLAGSTAAESKTAESKRPFLPLLLGAGSLLGLVVIGLFFLLGDEGEAAANVTADSPTATVAAEVTETAVPVAAGSLRFARPDDEGLRPYTLALDHVPPPPANTRYQLWFDFAGQAAPVNVAALTAQDGRIIYADMLVDDLADTVTGVRISLEPAFDDDPSISTNVIFTGTVNQETGLAEIQLFTTGR